jgi:hypothetical protein
MAVLLSVWRCQETWESKIVRAFSLREKDRMRGLENQSFSFSNPLTPTLSLRERGLSGPAVIPGISAMYKVLPTLADRALAPISSSRCGIGSIVNSLGD